MKEDFERYFSERVSHLGAEEALNVSETNYDGKGIRKVHFNPETARDLIEVPYNKGAVFNRFRGFAGLDNFLRLRGFNKKTIEKIHREIEKRSGLECPRCKSSNVFFQKVRRGSDEPEVFLGQCGECDFEWIEGKKIRSIRKNDRQCCV